MSTTYSQQPLDTEVEKVIHVQNVYLTNDHISSSSLDALEAVCIARVPAPLVPERERELSRSGMQPVSDVYENELNAEPHLAYGTRIVHPVGGDAIVVRRSGERLRRDTFFDPTDDRGHQVVLRVIGQWWVGVRRGTETRRAIAALVS